MVGQHPKRQFEYKKSAGRTRPIELGTALRKLRLPPTFTRDSIANICFPVHIDVRPVRPVHVIPAAGRQLSSGSEVDLLEET